MRQRFVPFIEELIRNYAGTPAAILCISHGGIYTMMFPLIMQNVDHAMITKYGFDYTSYTVAEHSNAGLFCIEWNGQPIENDNPAPKNKDFRPSNDDIHLR